MQQNLAADKMDRAVLIIYLFNIGTVYYYVYLLYIGF